MQGCARITRTNNTNKGMYMNQGWIVLIIPFLAGLIVWLLRKAKIMVNKKNIEEILYILYEIIFEVEKSDLSGNDKTLLAVEMAEMRLTKNQKKLIIKEKGGIANAIRDVFVKFAQPVIIGKQIVSLVKKMAV